MGGDRIDTLDRAVPRFELEQQVDRQQLERDRAAERLQTLVEPFDRFAVVLGAERGGRAGALEEILGA